MIPRNSPSATSSETSATIVAPPMSSPSCLVARRGWALTRVDAALTGEGRNRGHEVPWREALHQHRLLLAVRLRHQLDREHRLDQRVILLTDPHHAFRPDELPALERADHLVDVRAARLL